ncbi:uncharacterized protein LY89DRAFT_228580 [Mollisia scopiformis]|uniref:Uncharacterized protein n=1 Tax=Mollisia scopiformis TaxID=149040 RepID=A0A194WUK7_MOLSC|nr:uncharacterized protein LY89DRAFT_228580 [Mollisia scopiformis]KUJ11635.1 hypothetical protein LY89DRAFT_228580 [Mollisia scopiformis]
MRSLILSSLAALAVGSSASVMQPRNVANNNCGRAVAGTAKGTAFMSSARADCSSNVISYTTVTVTPLATTLTQGVDVQSTAVATSIETDAESTTGTSTILSTEVDQYVSTAYSTSIEIESLTVPTTTTPPVITATSVITVTSSSVSTVTSYYPTAAAVAKRDLEDTEFEDCEIEERDASSTITASLTIPAYASACTNWAEYVVC